MKYRITKSFYDVCLFISIICFHGHQCYPQLRLVHIITRHGDRSATVPYPADPYQESIWPQGTGQLTQQGMRQMYNLGLFVRQRYKGFLKERYDLHEWYTRSTDLDRTLMSAQSLLAAVYPPSGDQIWNEDIPWQPASVHTVPRIKDKVLEQALGTVPCPRHLQLVEETRRSEEYIKENATFKEIYDYVLPYSGISPPLTPILVWNVWDTLHTQSLNNYTLPLWVTEEVMTVIPEQIIPFEYKARFFPEEKTRLLAGVQLWNITNNMLNWINGKADRRLKVIYYSAHDDNIILSLIMFGLYYNRMISYASALFIELFETSENQFAVAVSLKNQTDSNYIYNLTIPGCSFFCPIDEFVNLTKQYSLHPDEHDEACQLRTIYSFGHSDLTAIGVVVGVFLLLVFILIFIYFKPHGRQKEKDGYSSI